MTQSAPARAHEISPKRTRESVPPTVYVADPIPVLRQRTNGIRVEDRHDSHHGSAAEATDRDPDDRARDAAPGDVAQHLAGR